MDRVDVELRPADLRQDMLQIAPSYAGQHDVVGAERKALTVDCKIARDAGAVDQVPPRDRNTG